MNKLELFRQHGKLTAAFIGIVELCINAGYDADANKYIDLANAEWEITKELLNIIDESEQP